MGTRKIAKMMSMILVRRLKRDILKRDMAVN
jgi:hypothetical protein